MREDARTAAAQDMCTILHLMRFVDEDHGKDVPRGCVDEVHGEQLCRAARW